MKTKSLDGLFTLVTGGAQGLGEALCIRLAEEGCAGIVVADINIEPARKVARRIEEIGAKALAVEMDITEEVSVKHGFRDVVESFGRLDILVSNAGIVISGEIDGFPAEQWRKVVDVNLIGYFLVAKHAVKIMKRQRSGTIVQINSKSGKAGSFKNSAYAASKFGGIGLTQSLAIELAEHGIRVNSVCPGDLLDSPLWVNSLYTQYAKNMGISEKEVRQRYIDRVPMKKVCSYDDVANLVVFLASEQSSYMTGQALNVTGGQIMH